jgi:ferritin-like metal-binding protein YciE
MHLNKNFVMQNMNDLKDLLIHEIQDLYSAEEQIIAALPLMIEKAKNPQLKKSLKEHLKVTERQLDRLQQVQQSLGGEQQNDKASSGLLSRLFKSKQTCRGMQGIIEEGKMVLNEDMDPDVKDAAIICAAQKVEHYEICGYGTARSFARELGLTEVQQLLEQTLQEEHMANDLMTQLAESRVNKDAEKSGSESAAPGGRSSGNRSGSTERVRQSEPELEMVTRGRTGASSGTTGKGGGTRGGGTPTGGASRNTASGRTTGGNTSGAASKRSITGGTSGSTGSGTGRSGSNRSGGTGSTGRNR